MAKLDDWVRMRISMSFFSSPPRSTLRIRQVPILSERIPARRPRGIAQHVRKRAQLPVVACSRDARLLQEPDTKTRENHVVQGYADGTTYTTARARVPQFAAVDFEATDQLTISLRAGPCGCPSVGPKFLSFPTTTERRYDDDNQTASRHEAGPVSRYHLTCGHQEV